MLFYRTTLTHHVLVVVMVVPPRQVGNQIKTRAVVIKLGGRTPAGAAEAAAVTTTVDIQYSMQGVV